MILRTGVRNSFEPSSPIAVRRFTFRAGEGQPERLLDGPRLATLVKATSSLSIIDVEGIRIVLDGPIGGRAGKQLIVQVLEEDSGLKMEVRPRPVVKAPREGAGSAPAAQKVAVNSQQSQEAPSPSVPVSQPQGGASEDPGSLAQLKNAGDALTSIAISESVQGSTRTTLLGVVDSQALPLRSGESLPVQAILARPDRTVFSLRGVPIEAEAGGFQNGKTYWAEVVSGPPSVVIRIQSDVNEEALQAMAAFRPSVPSVQPQSVADAPAVLLPGDLPSGTNLLARVLSRLPSGKFLLEVGGRQVAAPLPSGIQAGEEVLLRIEPDAEGAPQVRVVERLRNLTRRPAGRLPLSDSLALLSRQLKAVLGKGEESAALRRLAGKVRGMIGEDAPPSARRIASLVEESGLHYESKLARILLGDRLQDLGPLLQNDFKALLMRAQSEVRQQPEPIEHWARLAESVDRHLSRIEVLQTANLAAQSQSSPFQLEIPFLSGGHLSTVELFIQPDSEGPGSAKGPSAKGFNILFLLEMEGLGRTRVDAHLSGLSLNALIWVQHSSALETLRALLPRLEESLDQAGFRSARLGVRLLEERQAEGVRTPSHPASGGGAPPGLNLIDVVA